MTTDNDTRMRFNRTIEASPGDSISLAWNATHPVTGELLMVRAAAEIDQDLAQDHSAFAEMEMDLLDAATALGHFPRFSAETDPDIRQALYTEAVISYCRPFNRGYGRSQQLTCSDPWILDQGIEKKRHFEIVSIRDKVIAHSDRNSPFRSVTTYVLADAFPASSFVAISPTRVQIASISDEDAAEMRSHVLTVAERVRARLSKLEAEITLKVLSQQKGK